MLGLSLCAFSSLCALQKRTQSSLPYCDPWSECMISRCFGFRLHTALQLNQRLVGSESGQGLLHGSRESKNVHLASLRRVLGIGSQWNHGVDLRGR